MLRALSLAVMMVSSEGNCLFDLIQYPNQAVPAFPQTGTGGVECSVGSVVSHLKTCAFRRTGFSCEIVTCGLSVRGEWSTRFPTCVPASASQCQQTCVSRGPCRGVGVCNSQTGSCSDPQLSDGTPCTDSNQFTVNDRCVNGVCVGAFVGGPTTPVASCPGGGLLTQNRCWYLSGLGVSCGETCTQNSRIFTHAIGVGIMRQLLASGIGQSGNSGLAVFESYNPLQNTISPATFSGAGSSDPANYRRSDLRFACPCDTTTTGQGSSCTLDSQCTALTECHSPGTCDPLTRSCTNPVVPDGSICSIGVCSAGTCVPNTGGGTNCVAWRATTSCVSTGGRLPSGDLPCSAVISSSSSGFCECIGTNTNMAFNCQHSGGFTCEQLCSNQLCSNCPAPGPCFNRGTCSGSQRCTSTMKPNGSSCTLNNGGLSTCVNGVCSACVSGNSCPAPSVCHQTGVCNGQGQCIATFKPDGSSCLDPVTNTMRQCQVGVCGGTQSCPVGSACPAPSECHNIGVCGSNNVCTASVKQDGSPCVLGGQTGRCSSGVCLACSSIGSSCPAPSECHNVGTCDATLQCTATSKPNGTPCSVGSCQNSVCVSSSQSSCTAQGQICNAPTECHLSGTCSSSLQCVAPFKTDNTPCSLGTCQNGICQSTTTGSCSVQGVSCTRSECHEVGTCDASLQCSAQVRPNGTPCSLNRQCQNGICSGATNACTLQGVVCTAPSECHNTGICDISLQCVASFKTDGTPCSLNRQCQSGVCTATTASCTVQGAQCNAPSECHNFGVCNSAMQCIATTKANGTPCSLSRSCQNGVCTTQNTATCAVQGTQCNAPSECHNSGVCNSALQCIASTKVNGTPCSLSRSCQNGVCTTINTATCTVQGTQCNAPSECHNSGVCNSALQCIASTKVNGTPCSLSRSCQNGVCTTINTATCTVQGTQCNAPSECHNSGVCNSALQCIASMKANGTPCSLSRSCQNGVCTTINTATCTVQGTQCNAPSECHNSGVCNSALQCIASTKVNGTPCSLSRSCQNGVCTSVTTPTGCNVQGVQCTVSECHNVGICNQNLQCVASIKGNGSPCSQGRQCLNGVCSSVSSSCTVQGTQCNAPSECHNIGTCSASGQCVATTKTNGTPCSLSRTCQNGVCTTVGSSICSAQGLQCTPSECHNVGTCDINLQCSASLKVNGSPCSLGSCQNGICTNSNSQGCTVAGISCPAPTACHNSGTCNGVGQCVATVRIDGTICVVNGQSGTCTNGVCSAGTTLLQLIQMRGDLGTFNEIAQRSNSMSLLSTNSQQVTLLAPTDSAFTSITATRLNQLRTDTNEATQFVRNHIISGRVSQSSLSTNPGIQTLGGNVISGSSIGFAQSDSQASNGVLHVTTQVIDNNSQQLDSIQTIISLRQDLRRFSAILQSNLFGSLPSSTVNRFTIFAFSDTAYTELMRTASYTNNDFVRIVKNHIVPGYYTISDLRSTSPGTLTNYYGSNLVYSISRVSNDIVINGVADVEATDRIGSDGVVHIVDTVLVPSDVAAPVPGQVPGPIWTPNYPPVYVPTPTTVLMNSVMDILRFDRDLTLFVSALQNTGVDMLLQNYGLTVIAVSNSGLRLLPTALSRSELLRYIINRRHTAADLVNTSPVPTLSGESLQVTVLNNRYYINGNTYIRIRDLTAVNGIVHVIDEIINPISGNVGTPIAPPPVGVPPTGSVRNDIMTTLKNSGNQFGAFISAMIESQIDHELDRPGPWTVFAPTDAAFQRQNIDVGLLLQRNDPDFINVMRYHVANGLFQGLGGSGSIQTILTPQVVTYQSNVLNNHATIINPGGTVASNGIIYALDAVLSPQGNGLFQTNPPGTVGVPVTWHPGVPIYTQPPPTWGGTWGPVQWYPPATPPPYYGPAVPPGYVVNPWQQGTVTLDVAMRNYGNLGQFVQLLTSTGLLSQLSTSPSMTVLAPTDSALSRYGMQRLQQLPQEQLTYILRNHIIPQQTLRTDSLLQIGTVKSLQNDPLYFRSPTGDQFSNVLVNNIARIQIPNIAASNGYLHIIDSLLVPGNMIGSVPGVVAPPTVPLPYQGCSGNTVCAVIRDDSRTTTFYQMIQGQGLLDFLNNNAGPYTVFAPSNTAMSQNAALLGQNAQLRNILMHQIVVGQVVPSNQISGGVSYPRLHGGYDTLTSVGIIDGDNSASNGVVHVTGNLMVPTNTNIVPGPVPVPVPGQPVFSPNLPPETAQPLCNENTVCRTISIHDATSVFASLLQTSTAPNGGSLLDMLADVGPFTVFAPTNFAFQSLQSGVREWLLRDVVAQKLVLQHHIILRHPGQSGFAAVELPQNQLITMLGQTLTARNNGRTVQIGVNSTISTPDLGTQNGVVHILSSVLIPQSVGVPTQNVMQILEGLGNTFSTFTSLLSRVNLDASLRTSGPYTVLAPSNSAFESYGSVRLQQILNNPVFLSQLLAYHIVPVYVQKSDFTAGGSFPTLDSNRMVFSAGGVHESSNGLTAFTSVLQDTAATNGIVQSVNSVLEPPNFMQAAPTCTITNDCSGMAIQVTDVGGQCFCSCLSGIGGSRCEVCAAGFSGQYPNCFATPTPTAVGETPLPTTQQAVPCTQAQCNNNADSFRVIVAGNDTFCQCSCNLRFSGTTCGTCASGRVNYPDCDLPSAYVFFFLLLLLYF
eukprot:TRINITY_DN1731_c0_g2_i1.p1 TRINITY_DN1731_c0_g2~~TRINITY_DN1731_c0_g2_i1.p1  ORF type:complete len:2641 (+),score=391.08 TRINITY_DN1731_c0_g2_i1:115-8037(+)